MTFFLAFLLHVERISASARFKVLTIKGFCVSFHNEFSSDFDDLGISTDASEGGTSGASIISSCASVLLLTWLPSIGDLPTQIDEVQNFIVH